MTTIDESRMPASGSSRPWLALPPGGDFYWTVVFDELDVPYVVRAKITPLQ
ncbi:MAG: hypothetical protein OXH49_10970 [Gemmatimonadetes bacterium]|nr:hypothetical protein [Gemmatimonadota bacterium]